MKVAFRSTELQKRFERQAAAVRAWGDVVARNYIKRIRSLQATEHFEDLERLPQLGFHLLKGNRKDQYAINLTGRARLIIVKNEEEIDSVVIYEVDLTHYGK